jgi:hypothetical protein
MEKAATTEDNTMVVINMAMKVAEATVGQEATLVRRETKKIQSE